MLSDFPLPILSLSADILQHTSNPDLSNLALLTLFTKCKHYIQDGPRLENIAWRICRHKHSTPRPNPPQPSCSDLSQPAHIHNSASTRSSPIPHFSGSKALPVHQTSQAARLPTPASSSTRLSSHHLTPIHFQSDLNTPHPVPFGKAVSLILPQRLSLPSRDVSNPRRPLFPPTLVRQDTDSGVAESIHENEEESRALIGPLLVEPQRSPPSPALRPKVVIVNPTPHPTPPATPSIRSSPSSAAVTGARPTPSNQTGLLLPKTFMPQMLLPEPAIIPAAAPPPPSNLGTSVTTSSSTASSDGNPTKGKLFFLSKSSSQSDAPLNSIPPTHSRAFEDSTNNKVQHESEPRSVEASFGPSSINSTHLRSDTSSLRMRKGKHATRHSRLGSRGKITTTSGKVAARSSISSKEPAASENQRSAIKAESSRSRSRDRGHARLSSEGNNSRSSAQRPLPQQRTSLPHDTRQIKDQPNVLARVATQPLPHPHHPPTRQQGGIHPLDLTRPMIPPPNGNRRKVEVVSGSDTFESEVDGSEWSSTSGDEELEQTRERKVGTKGTQISQAVNEVLRQRSFFAKLPQRSYSNLATRTQSGLLTNLFHPDPNLFPEGHPYRTSLSHHDLVSKTAAPGQGPLYYGAMLSNTTNARRSQAAPAPASMLSTSKSSAALPEMARVTVGSNSRGYRPRARPVDVEVSDSDDDDPQDAVQMSRSVAQKKLEALAKPRKKTILHMSPTSNSPQSSAISHSTGERPQSHERNGRTAVKAVIPLAVQYPYNLPAPNPPSSPGTTRNRIWENELSASVSASLLTERKNAYGLDKTKQAKSGPEQAAEERRRQLLRNKSWAADDFHSSGW